MPATQFNAMYSFMFFNFGQWSIFALIDGVAWPDQMLSLPCTMAIRISTRSA
jgi:hypothetical protein